MPLETANLNPQQGQNMILRVTQYGEPVLREQGKPIAIFDSSLRDLSLSMIETMHESRGIGLAAQQIGIPAMLCVVDLHQEGVDNDFSYSLDGKQPPLDLWMPLTLVNPVIEGFSKETDFCEEGCLSFPGIHGEIERPDAIQVSFLDTEGKPHTLSCNGYLARCIQHEVDHLNGVLFIDRMEKDSLRDAKPAIRRLKERTIRSMQKAVRANA